MNDLPTAPPPAIPTNWRLLLELFSLCFFFLPPVGNFLGPLILWAVKKDSNPIINEEGKEVINFNLSWTIWGLATLGFGFLVWFVIDMVAIIKAANNEPFKHPLTIAFLK